MYFRITNLKPTYEKVLRIALITVLIVLLLAGSFAAFIHFRGIPTYKPQSLKLAVEVTEERVQHGEKLSMMLCVHCHSGENTSSLIGKEIKDAPPEFGKIYSMNITQDKENGIGNWTDGDLYYFLRTGVRPNGTYAPPYMPKVPLMSDEDVYSIIAFLRSDHPIVQPKSEEAPPSQPSFLTKFLCAIQFKPFPLPEKQILIPDSNQLVEFGKYLINARYDCYNCHSADFKTNDPLVPEKSPGYLAGGNLLLDMDKKPIYSANITPHEKTGIGLYTEEDFANAVRLGQRKDGSAIRYPMPPYTLVTNHEVKAMYAYLRTITPVENDISKKGK